MAAKATVVGDYKSGNLRQAGKDLNYIEAQAKGFSKSFMAGFAGVGASIGGLVALQSVVTFFKDSAQAAMDDQKSMVALAQAMDNVGLSAQNAKAEGLIESMMLQTGIADDKLRPAFQKLVTATQDVGKAQGLLQTALDLSAAGYGDLESASKALSAAAMGNFTALQRLKVPIDANIIKTKDFQGAIEALNGVVGGQAAAAAQTYAGQMERIKVAVGEAQEAIGYALLRAMDDLIGKMGGTGGLQGAIMQAGDSIASMIDQVALAGRAVDDLGRELLNISTGGLVKVDDSTSLVNEGLKAMFDSTLALLMGPLPPFIQFLKDMGWYSDDAAASANDLALANEHGARASMQAAKGLSGLGDDTEDAGAKAWEAAKGYYAFYSTLAQGAQLQRDLANTSGSVIGAIQEGFSGKWLKGPGEFVKQYGEAKKAADGLGSSAGGAASEVDKLTNAQQRAADEAKQFESNVQALSTSLQGLIEEVSGATAQAGKATFDGISKQIDAFKSAFEEAKSFAQGIVSSFMGELDLGAALDQAKSAGTSIVEEFAKQGEKAAEFGRRMKELLAAGLSKSAMQDIMGLGFERGLDVMKSLQDGNVAQNIAGINDVYNSVATMANSVADQARAVFYDAGLSLILTTLRGMMDELLPAGKTRRALMGMMDDLAASMNRTATITIATVYTGSAGGSNATPEILTSTPIPEPVPDAGNFYGGIRTFAEGGIATAPTLGIFGEAGPEALIPLDRMGSVSGGGNTYNITVQAGVGDPRAIGKTVVEAITLFERSSGPVFARA